MPTSVQNDSNDEVIIAPAQNMCGCDSGGVATPGIQGRVGAGDYTIDPAEWNKPALDQCDTLYSVGGVYGNLEAMKTVNEMIEHESGKVLAVYNGDYHWFDGTAENFKAVEKLLDGCIAMNGNVELELARVEDCGVGCGCSYPTTMSDAFVGRSNAIHERMKDSIAPFPELLESLRARPAWGVIEVGDVRVGLTHGDEQSVSGWGCSVDSLRDPDRVEQLKIFFEQCDIDVLSTTHTCAAAALGLPNGVVINNGSAGLPEYRGKIYGIVNRISKTPHPDALYRTQVKGIYVEAVPVRYNQDAFMDWFDSVWSLDSAAAESYRPRAVAGPDVEIEDAVLGGFDILVPADTNDRQSK